MTTHHDEWINGIETLSEKHLLRLQTDFNDELTQISLLEKQNRSQFLDLQDIYNEWNEIKLSIHKVIRDNIINENKLGFDADKDNEIKDCLPEKYNDETEVVNYSTLTKKESDLRISPLIFSKTFHLTKRSSWNASTTESDTTILIPTHSPSFNGSLDMLYSSEKYIYRNKTIRSDNDLRAGDEAIDDMNKCLSITPTKLRYTASKSDNSSPIRNNFRFFKIVDTKKDDLNYSFSYNTSNAYKDKDKKLMKDLKIKLLEKQPYINQNINNFDSHTSGDFYETSFSKTRDSLNAVRCFDSLNCTASDNNNNNNNNNTRNSLNPSMWSFFDSDSNISVTEKEKLEKILILVSFLIGILAVILYQLM